GYSTDELIGKELWQIGLFQDIEASQAAFQRLQDEGYIRYHDLPLETKSGRKAEVEFISNVYNVDHHAVIQCNIRDITERRQLERAEAQAEALADLHRRKDEFLAMLSHELRNPLAAITNAVQILDLQKDEHPLQEKAKTIIRRQAANLVVLVNDLLEVSRILGGRIQLHQEDLDARGIVQQALETQAPRSLDRSQGGLGVGLAVVRKLVEMHGGTVEAQSAGPGKGSEFIVRLPVLSPPTGRSQIPSKKGDEQSGSGWRVLVVDD